MFSQGETVLNPIFLILGVLFLILIIIRLRAVFFKKKSQNHYLGKSAWVILETCMSLSIPENLPKASLFRRISHFFTVLICLAQAVLLEGKSMMTR